jgi:hypothetical protein
MHLSGNGKDEIRIHVTEIDENYVVFTVGEHAPCVDATKALNQAVIDWYNDKGPAIIWSTVPIVQNGATWAIHVWFE